METTMFWSCTGIDAAELSFGAAKLMADTGKTLIAELPCLGIPRLGFVCGVMDRGRNTEAAITYFEQNRKLSWDMAHSIGKRLYALPASVFAAPDYPVAAKASIETLRGFVSALHHLAASRDCDHLVLECQGQMHSPMAFFSLKIARQVVVPLGKTTDAAYALACIRRLAQVYKHSPGRFILASATGVKAIENVVCAKGRDSGKLDGLRVTAWDCRKVKSLLDSLPVDDESTDFTERGEWLAEAAKAKTAPEALAAMGASKETEVAAVPEEAMAAEEAEIPEEAVNL